MADIQKYFWVTENTSLLDYRSCYKTAVPVLYPENELRRLRWSSVLHWYGMEEIPCPIKQTSSNYIDNDFKTFTLEEVRKGISSDSPALALKNWVVVIGDTLVEPTSVYSYITGRLSIKLKSVAELDDLFSMAEAAESILFVAVPNDLKYEVLNFITWRIHSINSRIEWGVVTAQDPGGLSFVFAKLLTDSNKHNSFHEGVLDLLHHCKYQVKPGKDKIIKYSLNPALVEKVINSDWKTLIIVAHGEGSHANLESVVLCGITSNNELDGLGREIAGCRLGVCKRARDGSKSVFSVYNLRNQIAVFLSCNGFSVSKELYPSNLSYILSASEGFTKAVITTTKCMPFDENIPIIFQRLIQNGMSLGSIVKFKNNVSILTKSVAPYILFGDPLLNRTGFSDISVKVGSSGEFSNVGLKQTVYLDLQDWNPNNTVVEVIMENKKNNPLITLGLSNALIINCGSELNGRLVDRTKEFEENLAWLEVLMKSIEKVKVLEQAINRFYPKDFQVDPELGKTWNDIYQIRVSLTDKAYEMLCVLKQLKQKHLWEAQTVYKFRKSIDELKQLWDLGFSVMVSKKLLSKSLYQILHYYCLEKCTSKGQVCNRCGATTIQTTYYYLNNMFNNRAAVECPVCGELYEYSDNGCLMVISLLNKARPGESAIFKIENEGDDLSSALGILVGEITDKSRGKVFHRIHKQGEFGVNGIKIEVPLPEDVGFDLHTIKLAWIQSMEVSYTRFRFPVVN
jgi:hypothetical protein